MPSRYDEIVEIFREVTDTKFDQYRGRQYVDTRKPNFTLHDIEDVQIDGNGLMLRLKDGRSWEGPITGLTVFEDYEVLHWAEVKAVEAKHGLAGGFTLGMHSKKERRMAINLGIDAYKRGIEAGEGGDVVGMAASIGYIRGLADVAMKENAEDVARICIRQVNDLIFKFKRDFPGLS